MFLSSQCLLNRINICPQEIHPLRATTGHKDTEKSPWGAPQSDDKSARSGFGRIKCARRVKYMDIFHQKMASIFHSPRYKYHSPIDS